MAVMPRPKGKGKQVFYAVLGKPSNVISKKNKREKQIERRLNFEETIRVR
jgi:hypothetical protein